MNKSTTIAVLLLAASGVANVAYAKDSGDGAWKFRWHDHDRAAVSPVAAPEIDPASLVAGVTLLCGGLAMLRGRRQKKPTSRSDEG
jgi:hypothetical protein